MIVPVVLCNGASSDVRPRPRKPGPRRLLASASERTPLEATLDLLSGLADAGPILVCDAAARLQVAEQSRRVHPAAIVLEPTARGAAARTTVAAFTALEMAGENGDRDPLLIVAPTDQKTAQPAAFRAAVRDAVESALRGDLVVLGDPAAAPEPGRGYVVTETTEDGLHAVRAFFEEPDRQSAELYLAADAWWSTGVFVFRASRWLAELRLHAPDILSACEKAFWGAVHGPEFLGLPETYAPRIDSIERAVLEHVKRCTLVPVLESRPACHPTVVTDPRMVQRPWGQYEVLDEGPRYKVKRLTVAPGAQLSLQYHTRRAEHWVIVAGEARVTRGETVQSLAVGQSVHIPVRMHHRVENAGSTPLELIEVQSGDYLGEDDIVRLQDRYGRTNDRPLSNDQEGSRR